MTSNRFLSRHALQSLIDVLRQQGYRVIGPTVRDGAVQYLDIEQAAQLPAGVVDAQSPGHYRLGSGASQRTFAWANGPQALKPYLFSAREVLWRSSRDTEGRLTFSATGSESRPLAVIGARACDLAALDLHDRHFLEGVRDPTYAARRGGLFTIAVHCTHPADTCFCASTGDGPRAGQAFDLALSELDEGFVISVGSDAGQAVSDALPTDPATPAQIEQSDAEIAAAAGRQTRRLPSRDLKDTLFARLEHAAWDDVGQRCLACGNCTSVCPTCFCHAEYDTPSLDGRISDHVRDWDSCFSEGHAYLHGFQIRPEIRQRFRQWMTHKLGSWHDQFGRSGCVGCGRCITWCPVGIDITVEAQTVCGDAAGGDQT